MDDGCATSEGPEKADHEIDGVVRRKDAEVAHAGPEGIERGEGHTLLEIFSCVIMQPLGVPPVPDE